MGGEFTYPKMVPLVSNHGHLGQIGNLYSFHWNHGTIWDR